MTVLLHSWSRGRLLLVLLVGACSRGESGGATASASSAQLGLGRPPLPDEIAAWDIDVNPTGMGLPAGSGTAADGARIFAAKCAVCHGTRGEGMHPAYPALIGVEPRDFSFDDDAKKVKTVGNYWPYATTLFDYMRRTMPLTTPGSLQADELYALSAFLLAENHIIPADAVMDATTLPPVRMPAREQFVVDDRKGGPAFR